MPACLDACLRLLEIPKHAAKHAAKMMPKSFQKTKVSSKHIQIRSRKVLRGLSWLHVWVHVWLHVWLHWKSPNMQSDMQLIFCRNPFEKTQEQILMHSNAFLKSFGAIFHGCMFGCMCESTGNPQTCSQICSLYDAKIFPKDKSKLQAYPDPFPKGIAAPFMAACLSACLTACLNPLEIPKRSQTCSLYCAEIRCKKRKHKSYYIQMLS